MHECANNEHIEITNMKKDTKPTADEREETNKNWKTLPKIGAVCEQLIRCGKPNCRCAHGELHGPYFYMFYRDGGRLRKLYVKREYVDRLREAAETRRSNRRLVEKSTRLLREFKAALKEIETCRS